MAQASITWPEALAKAGCYAFLEPVAEQAVDDALGRCPVAAPLVGEGARDGGTQLRAHLPFAHTYEEAVVRNFVDAVSELLARFHGLGSRDMTCDNLMCCGERPAVLDLEMLLVGEMGFVGDGWQEMPRSRT